jgi:hypothetical protein
VSASRDVRAKALLQLAGCDEKLGKQAKQLYEQIVREYSDQPAASQARTRFGCHPATGTSGAGNDQRAQDRFRKTWILECMGHRRTSRELHRP